LVIEREESVVSLHGLTSITLGVPDVEVVSGYYEEFGLTPSGRSPDGGQRRFATDDGGEQLVITHAPRRRLLEIGVGADDPDDLDRIESNLARLGAQFSRSGEVLVVDDPHSALRVSVSVAPRIVQSPAEVVPMNGPGRPDRANVRAPGIERTNKVRPRRLGHVVVGSLDQEASQHFFTQGLGFKVTDHVPSLGVVFALLD
jgi:hypothetical protein